MGNEKKPDRVREQPLTYDDYAAMPDDGNRYELVDGELELMTPAPSSDHQMISSQIERKILQSCEEEYIILHAPLDVILAPIDVRQPDIIMIHRSRIEIIKKRGIQGSPDLVVEILSPSTIRRDRIGKLRTYAQYEIPEFWIVDPFIESLEQYVLKGKEYNLAEVYTGDELVKSNHILCVSFSINEIMSDIPKLGD
jgi:Uma2 family endonuclease